MTETVENTPVDLSNYEDETVRKLWLKVKADEPTMFELHEKIQKSSPPSAAEVNAVLKDSEDPEIVNLRKQIEAAETRLANAKAKAAEYVAAGFDSLSDEEISALKDEFRVVSGRVKAALGLVQGVADSFGLDDVVNETKRYQFPTLRGVGGTTKSTGESTPRAHISKDGVSVTKPGKETKVYDRLAAAATYLATDSLALLNAWLSAAGVDKWQDVKETVTFEYEGSEVTVTPKV